MEVSPQKQFRIIDANLNRIGEGLRLLEDIARLTLDDASLTEKLKTMRHELTPVDQALNQRLLQARDAERDVGADIELEQQQRTRQLYETVIANSRRLQQSMRVIEELAKTPHVNLKPAKFKQARFSLYTLERELISMLLRQDKAERILGLYAIIDTDFLKGRSHAEFGSAVIKGGASIIQLRDRTSAKRELLFIARYLGRLCAENNVLFIINDHLDLALAADADGLHLGQQDLPVAEARRLLPLDKIIGCSVINTGQAKAAAAAGADYIAAGAIFPTETKTEGKVIGLESLRAIKKTTTLPLVAIGGIGRHNAAEVVVAGADSVAVISAIMAAESPETATRQIVNRIGMKE